MWRKMEEVKLTDVWVRVPQDDAKKAFMRGPGWTLSRAKSSDSNWYLLVCGITVDDYCGDLSLKEAQTHAEAHIKDNMARERARLEEALR